MFLDMMQAVAGCGKVVCYCWLCLGKGLPNGVASHWADLVACTQVDSEWNAFVYVCDGDGVVCGTKAEREQVRIFLERAQLRRGHRVRAHHPDFAQC